MKLSRDLLKSRLKMLELCVTGTISFSCRTDSIMHLLLQGRPMLAWLFSRYGCLRISENSLEKCDNFDMLLKHVVCCEVQQSKCEVKNSGLIKSLEQNAHMKCFISLKT